jgi:hypothetical protein
MTCSLLVKKPLMTGGLLAFMGSMLVKKTLAGCRLEVVVLMLPQFVERPLPILVDAFRVGTSPQKNRPPGQFWRQQAGSLLVFAQGATDPIVWGVADPVGSARRRLCSFILQPPRRIGEGGQGQMSRQ